MPKRFVIVCSFAPSLVNFRGPLLEQIRANGHDVLALAPDFEPDTRAWCHERGIKTGDITLDNQSLNPLHDMASLWQIYRQIKRFRADVVMGYTHKPALYTALAGRLAGTPHTTLMITGLGFGFEADTPKKRVVNKIVSTLFWLACRASHHAIFHNSDNLDFFRAKGIIGKRTPTTVVGGSGVDLSLYPRHPTTDSTASSLTFLLVARIVVYKGILEYAQAASQLRKRYPRARFLLAGYLDKSPAAYKAEEWAFIDANVTYLGKSSDVSSLLRETDVYVLPSYGEGLPRTVLEAMASGRAIITTDAPGCRQCVEEGRNGFLVKSKDPIDLEKAMERFLSGQADWRAMGEASFDRVRSVFEVGKVNADMIRALDLQPD